MYDTSDIASYLSNEILKKIESPKSFQTHKKSKKKDNDIGIWSNLISFWPDVEF